MERSGELVDASQKLVEQSQALVKDPRTQAEKFADLSRELECDESDEGFDEKLRGLQKQNVLSHPPSQSDTALTIS